MTRIEDAAAMGFKREPTERALAMIEAFAAPADTLDVAMDLARFVKVPLDDATFALLAGGGRLRRLGFNVGSEEVLAFVRPRVEGQSKAFAATIYGRWEVSRARFSLPSTPTPGTR